MRLKLTINEMGSVPMINATFRYTVVESNKKG